MGTAQVAYRDALQQTFDHIQALPGEGVGLSDLTGRVAAEDLLARVDSPSVDVSFKDGYAVQSADISRAAPESPVSLTLAGHIAAGGQWDGEVQAGMAVRILSGARVPDGAQAVVAEEFTRIEGGRLLVVADAQPGRNVLPRGSDVRCGQILVRAGEVLQPAQVGLLAAGGHDRALVVRRPRVAIIATGDEVVAPGTPLKEGKLFASNLVTLAAWCSHYGMHVTTEVVRDEPDLIRECLAKAAADQDAVLTSGGAWTGDHDLVAHLLDALGWEKIYHRVKIGPGKAAGFGLLNGKPVFCLPGGPPSNYMAFINLALPGLLKLSGYRCPGLPSLDARLAEQVRGQLDWTQFVHGTFERREGVLWFQPLQLTSRLEMMAQAEGILTIPEGTSRIPAGEQVSVQVLAWPAFAC